MTVLSARAMYARNRSRSRSAWRWPSVALPASVAKALEPTAALLLDMAAGALLSRAALYGDGAPFAVAWMAARLLWDKWPLGTPAGIALGWLLAWQPVTLLQGWQLAVCALLLGARLLQRRIPLPAPWSMALMAGTLCLLPLPLFTAKQDMLFACVVSSVTAGVLVPAFDRVVGATRQRGRLHADDRICCLVAVMALVFGAAGFNLGGYSVGAGLAVFATVAVAWAADAGSAVVTGLCAGLALAFAGQNPLCMVSLALIGLVVPLAQGTKRAVAFTAAILANALVTVAVSPGTVVLALPCVAAGALGLMLLPNAFWMALHKMMDSELPAPATPGGVAVQWLQNSANALTAMAQTLPKPDGAEERENEQLACLLCDTCIRKRACWDEHFEATSLFMNDLLQAVREDSLTPREITQMARAHGCQRSDMIADALRGAVRAQSREDTWDMAQRQAARLAKSQLSSHAALMRSLSAMLAQCAAATPQERLAVSRALSRTPWRQATAIPYRLDGLLQITLVPPEGADETTLGQPPVEALQNALITPLTFETRWDGLVQVSEKPALRAEVGASTCPAHGQTANGDGWIAVTLPRGQQLLALSDGMGHGRQAAQESHAVLQLLKEGFEAGYTRRDLLGAVNELMRSCHGAERYATVDLCLLDLRTGDAAFEKMGACASYLIRQGKCRRLTGGTLPMGILEDVAPKSFRMRLLQDDLLVMLSDGVTDAFESDAALLKAMAALPREPEAFAEGLRREAARLQDGEPHDDMSVLAVRLAPEALEARQAKHARGGRSAG